MGTIGSFLILSICQRPQNISPFSMTTVEPYRSTSLSYHPDATSKPPRTYTSPTTIRRIPPAVPSPPRLSEEAPRRKPVIERKIHANTMTDRPSQWLFSEAEIRSTPSVLDGIQPADERIRRAKGVNFIIQAGILLKLPQLTLATASVFFHRFFMRMSMVVEKGGLHHYNIAATALFLATKSEENCRKTKEIVIAVAKVAQKNASLIIDEQSKEYWRWRDNILLYEELMLEYLTFDVVLQSPYTHLYKYISHLHIEDNKQVRNLAWSFINDSCLSTLCLLSTPREIAVAAIYFGVKGAGDKIEDDELGVPWWEQLECKSSSIVQSVGAMHDFWRANPLGKSDNAYEQSPTSSEEDLNSTRRRRDEGSVDPGTPSPEERRYSIDSIRPSQEEDAPAINGHKSEETPSPTRPIDPKDIPTPSTEGLPIKSEKLDESVGSSDRVLKEAANDPETHLHNGSTNGMTSNLPDTTSTPKRRLEDAEEPDAKRIRTDDVAEPDVPTIKSEPVDEADEEGELLEE